MVIDLRATYQCIKTSNVGKDLRITCTFWVE